MLLILNGVSNVIYMLARNGRLDSLDEFRDECGMSFGLETSCRLNFALATGDDDAAFAVLEQRMTRGQLIPYRHDIYDAIRLDPRFKKVVDYVTVDKSP